MREEQIKCPICAELIMRDAKKCRFCGEWIAEEEKPIIDGGLRDDIEPSKGEQEEEHKGKVEETVKESSKRKPSTETTTERPSSESVKKRRQTPWLRIILVVLYFGIIVALVSCEYNARQILREAQANEEAQNHNAAFNKYQDIMEAFPMSFAVIEALEGLSRTGEQIGEQVSEQNVYWLPFIVWPACAVLLFLVLLTRIVRPGAAFLSCLLMIAAVAGSLAQLSWYGLVPSEPIAKAAQVFMKSPVAVYGASYLLFILTALMTLTATSKHRSPWAAKQIRSYKCRHQT